jgi:multidrug efflux pump subunit AcrA (membrane-fusion protein)
MSASSATLSANLFYSIRKTTTKYVLLTAAFCTAISPVYAHAKADTNEILLTGVVSSAAKQVVNAPKTSRWQSTIQWLAKEGEIVEKGGLVAVFDGALEQTQLSQNEETIERLQLELAQMELEQAQRLIDAQGQLKLAKMRVEKANIEASVPETEVSKFEKGQFELALQRALLEQVKAEDALARTQKENDSNLQKKKLDILKTQEQITYLTELLSRMNIRADHTGPVNYAMHPWYGTKIAAGSNVNASWKILDVQAIEDFLIETWVHEVDAVALNQKSDVALYFDAYPETPLSGKIKKISTQAEKYPQWSKSSYFPLIIEFDGDVPFKLMPGMSVRVEIKQG